MHDTWIVKIYRVSTDSLVQEILTWDKPVSLHQTISWAEKDYPGWEWKVEAIERKEGEKWREELENIPEPQK